MKIRHKLTIAFGVLIIIIGGEVILNQVITSQAKTTYEKLKLEIEPAIKVLDGFSGVNTELQLLTNNRINNPTDLGLINRIKEITEVEFPYYQSETRLQLNNDYGKRLEKSIDRILGHSDSILILQEKLGDLLVTLDDYRNPAKTDLAYEIVDEKLAPLSFTLGTDTYQLQRNYNEAFQKHHQDFSEKLSLISNLLLIFGSIGVVLGILIAFRTIHSIMRPINQLKVSAELVKSGTFEKAPPVSGNNELSSLTDSFNSMTESLKKSFEVIEEYTYDISQREAQMRSLLDHAIITSDDDGTITSWNLAAHGMFGWTEEEILGKPLTTLTAPKHRKQYGALLENFMLASEVSSYVNTMELQGMDKEGRIFPMEVSIGSWKKDNGFAFCGIIRDITDRVKAKSKLETFNQQLKNKNRELEQFAYIASHDLQEPLRTVTSFTDLIAKKYDGQFDEPGQKSLQYITESTERMRMLIKGLLDYSRIGISQTIEETDCNELVEQVLSDLNTKIEEVKATFEISPLPLVKCYPIELRALFQNLISNALKFTVPERTPHIVISGRELNDKWEFSIADNGIGIDARYKEKIFQIFQRLHAREEYGGTGIGLSHCKKITELHHGQIWFTSSVDNGTTFFFTIKKGI